MLKCLIALLSAFSYVCLSQHICQVAPSLEQIAFGLIGGPVFNTNNGHTKLSCYFCCCFPALLPITATLAV